MLIHYEFKYIPLDLNVWLVEFSKDYKQIRLFKWRQLIVQHSAVVVGGGMIVKTGNKGTEYKLVCEQCVKIHEASATDRIETVVFV